MIKRIFVVGVIILAGSLPASVVAQDVERFEIRRFSVEGNTLLTAERINELVAPFTGEQKVYGDVQRALEALEAAYRRAFGLYAIPALAIIFAALAHTA